MTEILSKIFIKSNNLSDNVTRKSFGTLAGAVGIATNILLASLKLVAGLFCSSVAIIADAFNNFSDAGASLITLISFKLSAKPADKEHPFGHARFEYISSMIVSFIIMLVGIELLISSGKRLFYPNPEGLSEINAITFIILGISILLKLWLGLFYRKIGKKIDSKVILAASLDSLTDSISTGSALLASIIVKLTGLVIFDSLVGIGVSIIIISAGAKILNDTKNALLGEAPVKETLDGIRKIAEKYPEIIGIHDLLVHNYGPGQIIASFHAEVDGSKDIYLLHDVIDTLEREIKKNMNISCTIHLDPIATNDENTAKIKEFLSETLKEVGLDYKIHDFRAVLGNTHTKLLFDLVLPFEEKISDDEAINLVCEAVEKKRNNFYCVITVDRE